MKEGSFVQSIENIICAGWCSSHNHASVDIDTARVALHILLNGNYVKYDLDNILSKKSDLAISNKAFQDIFSKTHRKKKGIYYTQRDVADYVVSNTIVSSLFTIDKLLKTTDAIKHVAKLDKKQIYDLVFERKFLDPTSGSGEFMISVIEWKLELCRIAKISLSDDDVIKICGTVFGNDIETESIDIAKMRIFFAIIPCMKNSDSYIQLAEIINSIFYHYDFILDHKKIHNHFDYIVGNPPYVEYSKYPRNKELCTDYGNLYADTLANSLNLLNAGGSLGLILPLSYVSTSRMSKLRDLVRNKSKKQIVLNFADRPDCLFVGAHQKISILIAQKGDNACKTFSSTYKHWYKNERDKLLNGREIFAIKDLNDLYIPKIGNALEYSIYNKVRTAFKNNILNSQAPSGKDIFLNMRACFWIKAFSFSPGSNEYKQFRYQEQYQPFILCVLNSGLFWLYWTIVSDCWHITNKDLMGFSVPEAILVNETSVKLAKSLEIKLEETKKYIGTKQTAYEYKHKLCKVEIDEIDDYLATIYQLSPEELDYVKNFALKYRISGGADD